MWRWPWDDFFWRTPSVLKWSRWGFLVISGLSMMTMACISFSWQQFSLILMEGQSYEWLCSDEEIASRPMFGGAACLAQEKATGDLFSYLLISQAISGLLAGIIVDHLDRRICGLVGVVINFIARGLLAASSPEFRAYDAGVVLDGLSCNLIAFPGLVLAELFPSHPNCATAFVLTAEFLGAVVTPVMWDYWRVHPEITKVRLWSGYMVAVMAPLTCLFLMSIPPKGVKRMESLLPSSDETNEEGVSTNDLTGAPSSFKDALKQIQSDHQCLSLSSSSSLSSNADINTSRSRPKHAANSVTTVDRGDEVKESKRIKCWRFARHIGSTEFLMFDLIYNIFMFQHTYYPAILRDLSGVTISNFQGTFQSSQAAWAISLGFLADYVSNQTVTLGLILSTALVFGLILAHQSDFCQYAAAVIFTIAHSYVFTIRFTFVRETFVESNRGKILGVIGMMSAVTNFVNIPVNRTTRYSLWSYVMMGLSACQLPLLWIWNQRRKQRGEAHYNPRGANLAEEEPGGPIALTV